MTQYGKERKLTRGQVDKGTRGCAMLLCRMEPCPLVNSSPCQLSLKTRKKEINSANGQHNYILNQLITGALDRHIQIVQYLFKQNSLPVIVLIAKSGTDTLKDKLRGTVQGNRKAVTLQ